MEALIGPSSLSSFPRETEKPRVTVAELTKWATVGGIMIPYQPKAEYMYMDEVLCAQDRGTNLSI